MVQPFGDRRRSGLASRRRLHESPERSLHGLMLTGRLPGCRLRQRAFFVFGMDVLLKLDLAETREFFAAFFALSDFHWQGFLSARLTFPQARIFRV